MPSSKTFSDSSSGRFPASSAATTCSRRARQSSNLRSVIVLPGRVDATVETSLVQQHVHLVADAHLAPTPHDAPGRRERQAVPTAEDRQRRQGVQPAGGGAEAVTRAVDAAADAAPQPALQ